MNQPALPAAWQTPFMDLAARWFERLSDVRNPFGRQGEALIRAYLRMDPATWKGRPK